MNSSRSKQLINDLVSQATEAATNEAFTQTLRNLVSEVESRKVNIDNNCNILFKLLNPVSCRLTNNAFVQCLDALISIAADSFQVARMIVKVSNHEHIENDEIS